MAHGGGSPELLSRFPLALAAASAALPGGGAPIRLAEVVVMGFLSKLGSYDPIGGKLHKIDPLGKYDIAGTAIYGSGIPAGAAGGGDTYGGVSGWNSEMQALHDYYARPQAQGGLGVAGQQAVGWNPGVMSQQPMGMPQSSVWGSLMGPNQGQPQGYGQSQPMGWRDAQMFGGSYGQGAMRQPMNSGGYDFGGYGGGQQDYRSSMYPGMWGRPAY